jgi:hypothetical protein
MVTCGHATGKKEVKEEGRLGDAIKKRPNPRTAA